MDLKTEPRPQIPEWQKDCVYKHLYDLQQFEGFPETCEYVSIDLETTGLDRQKDLIVGLSFSHKTGVAYYISLRHIGDPTKNVTEAQLLYFLSHHFHNKTIVYWNAKFDRAFLKRIGFKEKAWADASIYSYVNNMDICARTLRSSLKAHCKHFLGFEMLEIGQALGVKHKRGRKKEPILFHQHPVDDVIVAYACADADITRRLFNGFHRSVLKDPRLEAIIKLDHEVVDALDYIERCGLKVDLKYAIELKQRVENECAVLVTELQEINGAPFNPASSQQVAKLLFETLKLPILFRSEKTNAPSTAAATIDLLNIKYGDTCPALSKLHQYRTNKKLLSSCILPVISGINDETGSIHPNYNLTSTVTGRLSGAGDGFRLKKFNGQAIPKNEVRRMFIPHSGHTFVAIDLSNIEVRIIAQFSKDPQLLKMFEENQDMHDKTTKLVFNVDNTHPDWDAFRKKGKVMNFNLAYAFGWTKLAAMLKVPEEEAQAYYKLYFGQAYKTWGRWKIRVRDKARDNPILYTHFGRRRNLKYEYDIKESNGDRKSVNYAVQGTCADLIRKAMRDCYYYVRDNNLFDKIKMCGTVHDELTFSIQGYPGEPEFDGIVKDIKNILEYTPEDFVIPIKADPSVGTSWYKKDLKSWK